MKFRATFRHFYTLGLVLLFATACGKAGGNAALNELGTAGSSPSPTASSVGSGLPSTVGIAGAGGQNAPAGSGGAGGRDAGAVSAGGRGGSSSAVRSFPCGAPGVFLCDDFESSVSGTLPNTERWKVDLINSESVLVDSGEAHSGRNSVKVLGNGYRAFLRPVHGLPTLDNSLYLRVFVRSSTAMGSGHSTYVEAGKNAMDEHELRVGYHYKMLEVNLMPGDPEQLSSGRDYDDGTPGLQFAPNTWYCLEVHFDGQHSEARVWVNDTEILPLHVTNWNPNMKDGFRNLTDWAPSYASVGIGYEKYSGDPAILWYDDIALGTQRIGCR